MEIYAYFGSFRASDSGVGWNATMLDGLGELTNIGSWYLGGGILKNASTVTSSSASGASTTKSSNASEHMRNTYWILGAIAISALFIIV